MQYVPLLAIGAVVLILLLVIGFVMTRLYKRANPDQALVRTGVGGMKVATGGGMLVIPGIHNLLTVNLKTMPITVSAGDGLITKDQRRVDATAQFYICVSPESENIRAAARSLGADTNNIEKIRSLLEGKVQDTMRAITAGMDLIEIQQQRAEFVEKVRETMNAELEPNGLNLESVSLTHLDETPLSKLDENNTFDVTGMRARAEIIAEQRKKRIHVEEDAELEIARSRQQARINHLAIEQIEAEASSKQRIEVARSEALADTEKAKIAEDLERTREVARIERETGIAEEQIRRSQGIDIAKQAAAIEIAKHSQAQSVAEAEANEARAKAIAAEESIQTARATEIANRDKVISGIEAEKRAEEEAIGLRVRARAEREAAEDRAAAVIASARAEAEAEEIRAKAILEVGKAEAEVRSALVAAENSMSPEIMAFKLRSETVAGLPAIIRAMTDPISHVDSIRINQVAGLSGGEAGNGERVASGDDGIVGQLMSGVRRNAVAMPALKALGEQIGVDLAGGPDALISSIVPAEAAGTGAESVADAAVAEGRKAPRTRKGNGPGESKSSEISGYTGV